MDMQAKKSRQELVCGWCRDANALDVRAEALLHEIEVAREVMDAHANRPSVGSERTRGPRQILLREVAASLAKRHPEPARLHRAADGLYWQMVLAYEVSHRLNARTLAIRWGLDDRDLYQTIVMGWYQAALRFDPARGLSLYTSAKHYAMGTVQRSGLLQAAGIHVAMESALGQSPPKIRTLTFDMPLGGEGVGSDMDLKDLLTADGQMVRERPHPVSFVTPGDIGGSCYRDRAHALALVGELPEREREVLTLRYLDLSGLDPAEMHYGERSLGRVGSMLGGLSRERVRQIEAQAVGRLRARHAEPSGVARVPRSRPSMMTA